MQQWICSKLLRKNGLDEAIIHAILVNVKHSSMTCKYEKHKPNTLDGCLVCNRVERLGDVLFRLSSDSSAFARLGGDPFEINGFAFALGLCSQPDVLLHPVEESLSPLGVPHVLHTDVNSLFDESVSNTLVDDHTNGAGCNVVDNSSSAVVEFMGHALLLSGIGFDVHIVSNPVRNKEGRQFDGAVFFEPPLEHVARTRPQTE